MEHLKKIIFIGWLVFPFLGSTQIYFYNKYTSNNPFDKGNGITQLPDSSYAVTGSSGGFNSSSSQAYLMLLDSLGNRLWTKDYGGWNDDIGVRVIHLPGEGFFIAGYTGSTNEGDYDFVVYKTDEQGELLWQKKYGGTNWEILHDAKLLSDGGLILVGESEGPTTDGKDIFLVRTDALGDTIWTKTLSTPENDVVYAVDTVGTQRFLVGGDMGNVNDVTGTLISFQYDGTHEWQQFYDQDGRTTVRDIMVFNNKIYIAGGLYSSPQQYDRWIARMDSDGNQEDYLTNTYQSSSLVSTFTIRNWYSLYFGFYSDAPDLNTYQGSIDAFVLKFGTGFYYKNFSASFSYIGKDILNQMIVTNDGGIAIVGTSSDGEDGEANPLGTNVMVIKLGPADEYTYIANVGNDLVATEMEQIAELPIYPNPTHGSIHIPEKVRGLSYQLIDFQGKSMKEGKLQSTLSLEDLDVGLYFLKVRDEQQSWNAKVIKK